MTDCGVTLCNLHCLLCTLEMFIELLKSIFSLFCGTATTQQPSPQQYPASQYPISASSQPPAKWNQPVHKYQVIRFIESSAKVLS